MAVVGPGAPYVTPAVLIGAPTGISWSTIPKQGASPEQQDAEQLNICMRATAMVDQYCNTTLRATIDTEVVRGPGDYRFTVDGVTGVGRIVLSRPPVVSVLSGAFSPTAVFPSQWSQLAADQFKVEDPILGVYGTTAPGASAGGGAAVLLAPGYLTSAYGPHGMELQVTYLNGWPHTQLAAAANTGDTQLHVDDVTGWLGASGTIRDALGQETFLCTATSPSGATAAGPGTLTLSAPLAAAHAAGVLATTLPGSIEQAAILFCVAQALVRGGTAVTVQAMPGSITSGGKTADYAQMARDLLAPFRRVL